MIIKSILKTSELPMLDTQVLLAYVLGVDKSYLFSHEEESLSTVMEKKWRDAYQRALSGEPIAYITKTKEFYSLPFYVDERVLIPRPETEQLVEYAYEKARWHRNFPLAILEIGTGSGAVIVSLTQKIVDNDRNDEENLTIVATDISKDALAVAQENAKMHKVDTYIDWKEGDLFAPVKGEKFDIILANLPYLPTKEALSNRFEPNLALDGGSDGYDVVNRMLRESKQYLNDNGMLLYEHYGGQVGVSIRL